MTATPSPFPPTKKTQTPTFHGRCTHQYSIDTPSAFPVQFIHTVVGPNQGGTFLGVAGPNCSGLDSGISG